MMKHIELSFLMITALLLLNSCRLEKERIDIRFENHSSNTICFLVDSRLFYYSDISGYYQLPECGNNRTTSIIPGDFQYYEVFNNVNSDSNIRIFALNVDTLNTYTWNEVREGNKYLKRYNVNYKDLGDINYTITFP